MGKIMKEGKQYGVGGIQIGLRYTDAEVTTNASGEVYLGTVNSLITAFCVESGAVRRLQLHTYGSSVYGTLYNNSTGEALASYTFKVRRIYAIPAFS